MAEKRTGDGGSARSEPVKRQSGFTAQEPRFFPYENGEFKLMPEPVERTGYEPPVQAYEDASVGVVESPAGSDWGVTTGGWPAGTPRPPGKVFGPRVNKED